jgi:tetratricopeptide (TPR) repeat protein
VLSFQGRFDEALSIARRAAAVEPASKMMRTNLVYILVDAGRFEEGLQIAEKLLEEDPGYTVQRRNYFLHELRAGHATNAANTFVAYTASIGGDAEAAREIGNMFIDYAERGQSGRLSDDLISRSLLGSEDLAQVLAFIGDAEGTIQALQVAAAENSASRSVFSMKINPAYDFIRDDPRFIDLLQRVGLAD